MPSCPNSLLRFPYVFHAFLQCNVLHKSPPFSNTRSSAQTILVPFSLGVWILLEVQLSWSEPHRTWPPVELRMLHWLQSLSSSTGHWSFGLFIAYICLDRFFTKLSPLTFGVWVLPRCQAFWQLCRRNAVPPFSFPVQRTWRESNPHRHPIA